jgi:hypothetical protein
MKSFATTTGRAATPLAAAAPTEWTPYQDDSSGHAI